MEPSKYRLSGVPSPNGNDLNAERGAKTLMPGGVDIRFHDMSRKEAPGSEAAQPSATIDGQTAKGHDILA